MNLGRRLTFPKYFRSHMEPSFGDRMIILYTQWQVIYIYIYICVCVCVSRRENRWERNLQNIRIFTEGIRTGEKKIGGICVTIILECGYYIRSWSFLRKVCWSLYTELQTFRVFLCFFFICVIWKRFQLEFFGI